MNKISSRLYECIKSYPTTLEQVWTSAMLKFNMHTKKNKEEKLANLWNQTIPIPGNGAKIWSGKTAHKKCMFWKWYLKCVCFGFLDTSVIA